MADQNSKPTQEEIDRFTWKPGDVVFLKRGPKATTSKALSELSSWIKQHRKPTQRT